MCEASIVTGIGPMGSVAGAIAYYAVKAMVKAGAKKAIFDNGGDIAIFTDQDCVVGLYAGKYTKFKDIGLKFLPRDHIFGICTSSRTVGHSISFGETDATTIISKDVILADATATSLGNEIKKNKENELTDTMKKFMYRDIEGIIVVVKDKMGTCGKLPQLVKANVNYDLISKYEVSIY